MHLPASTSSSTSSISSSRRTAALPPPLPPRPLRSIPIPIHSLESSSSTSLDPDESSSSSIDDKPECPVHGIFAEDNQLWIYMKIVHKSYYDKQAIFIKFIRSSPFSFLLTYWRFIRPLLFLSLFLYFWFIPYLTLYRRFSSPLPSSSHCISPLPSFFLPLLPPLLPSSPVPLPFRKDGLPSHSRPFCTVADENDWEREEERDKWRQGKIPGEAEEGEERSIEVWEHRQLLYILEAFSLISPISSSSSPSPLSSSPTQGLGFGSTPPSHSSVSVSLLSRSSLPFNQPSSFPFSTNIEGSRDYAYCLRCIEEWMIEGGEEGRGKWIGGVEGKWKILVEEMGRVVKVGGVVVIVLEMELEGSEHYYDWWGSWSYRSKLDRKGVERLIGVAERVGLQLMENVKMKEQGMSVRNQEAVLNVDAVEMGVCEKEEKKKAGLLRLSEKHSVGRAYWSTISLVFVKQNLRTLF